VKLWGCGCWVCCPCCCSGIIGPLLVGLAWLLLLSAVSGFRLSCREVSARLPLRRNKTVAMVVREAMATDTTPHLGTDTGRPHLNLGQYVWHRHKVPHTCRSPRHRTRDLWQHSASLAAQGQLTRHAMHHGTACLPLDACGRQVRRLQLPALLAEPPKALLAS